MKSLIFPILLFFALTVTAQINIKTERASDHSFYVKGRDFEGVIFSDKYTAARYSDDKSIKQFTPSPDEVLQAESLFREDVSSISTHILKDAFIRKKIKKYLRQYAGFIQNGQRIIYVNFFWKDEILYQEKNHRDLPRLF